MHIIFSVFKDLFIFFKPNSRQGKVRLGVLVALVAAFLFFTLSDSSSDKEEQPESLRTVEVASVAALSSDSTFTLIGTVAAVSEADLKAEASGRITSVPVKLGQTVGVGAVIATLENSSQYAAVLQAEGVYDAAVAAAAQSDVSVQSAQETLRTAKTDALTAYTDAYTDMRNIFYVQLDDIFADPERTYRSPNFRPIDFNEKEGRVDTLYKQLEQVIQEEQTRNVTVSTVTDSFDQTQRDLDLTLTLVRLLRTLIADNDIDEVQEPIEVTYLATLQTIEQTLSAAKSDISSAQSRIKSAEDALSRAEIGGTSSEVSAANAQVKQALGSLRAAQANYSKTIVRSPIAGVINELSVKTGDFVSVQQRVALVANNNALEVTTFVGERDRDRLTIGSEVLLDGTVRGVVTAIAPAIDSVTRKFEVKIGAETGELTSGDSVTIVVPNATSNESEDVQTSLFVPITAVKFTDTNGVVFTVVENALVAHEVKLGEIRAGDIEVLEGVDGTMQIVIDARGLTENQRVEAIQI